MSRESDIQELCKQILEMNTENTGDSGSGTCCPICFNYAPSSHSEMNDIKHKLNCAYLIAKDLSTKQ